MKFLLLSWATVTAVVAAPTPRRVATTLPSADVVIASFVLAPPADATEDAAPIIQAVIDEASRVGGAVVFLSAGRYRLASPVIVKEGVTLRGEWVAGTGRMTERTLLLPVAGRGREDGPPAVTVERGTGLRELTLWYPEQSAEAPVPYPWTVAFSERVNGDNCTLRNVTLVNPWRGFRCGPGWNELHTLHNVSGTPLKLGVFIDTCTDIGRLTNVDFGPRWWAESGLPGAPGRERLSAWLRAEATGVDMGRSDWEYVYGLRVEGYQTGMVIRRGRQGETNAVLVGCDLVDCATALRLAELNGVGLAATDCRFAGEIGVYGSPAFTTIAQFNACRLSGGTAARLEGRGALTFVDCDFDAPVEARAGTFSAVGCRWRPLDPALRLAQAVRRARVLSCAFGGAPKIVNESNGDVQIAHTALPLERYSRRPLREPAHPRPATDRVWVVTDHGAEVSAADNTAAFQSALDTANQAGGGTVYVPAGRWRLRGELRVPTGVELRGIWDVPHHTQSDGSTLLALGGRGQADGPPLIQLAPRSGVRGLLVWHPEQDVQQPVPYPWVVRSQGPGCWAVDLTLGNAWQGVDFGSADSTGHDVRYLAGGILRKALWVSRSTGGGWVEDLQLNPHYAGRLPRAMPRPTPRGDLGSDLIRWQRRYLEGLVFGRCVGEQVRGTFLYAAYDGLSFRDDEGGSSALVVIHGSDTVSRPVFLEAAGPGGIEVVAAQLVPLSDQAVAAFVSDERFVGKAVFHNSQIWAGNVIALLKGRGEVVLNQLNTLSGPLRLAGGRCVLTSPHFTRDLAPAIAIEAGCEQARVLGALTPGATRVTNAIGAKGWIRANAASVGGLVGPASGLPPARFQASTGWEPGQPRAAENAVATTGGGLKSVSAVRCGPVAGAGRDGGAALRLAGNADDPAYSFVYCQALPGPLGVAADSRLGYWIRPENERGRATCVDLVFSDGTTLRDSPSTTTAGASARGAGAEGPVGEWREVVVPLAHHAGKVITMVMVAYDSRAGGGPFSVLFDDLRLSSELSAAPAPQATVERGLVSLRVSGGGAVRYTLDGTNPGPAAPVYTQPVRLEGPGLCELRFGREGSEWVGSVVVDGPAR
jgi:hypothetical protein